MIAAQPAPRRRTRDDAVTLALSLGALWLGVGAYLAWIELRANGYVSQKLLHLSVLVIQQSLASGLRVALVAAGSLAVYGALVALLARWVPGARVASATRRDSKRTARGSALAVRAASAVLVVLGLMLARHFLRPIPDWVPITAGLSVISVGLGGWFRICFEARGIGVCCGRAARRALRTAGCLSLATIAAFAGLGSVLQQRNRAEGPNILLVVFDAARKSNFSIYGHSRETTPNVDALAREGAVYENAFAVAPFTVPNHATLFTGLYSCQHGATQESRFLAARNLTLAEILYEHGYETAAFAGNPAIASERGYDQGFRTYFEPWRRSALDALAPPKRGPVGDDGAFQIQREVRRWLGSRAAGAKPFFAFVNLLEAHSPYDPPAAYRRLFLKGTERLNKGIMSYRYVHFLAGGYRLTPEEFEIAESLYDGEIRYADAQLAKIIEALRSDGLLDDTLLIVTSDHGEHFGEHGMVGHQFSLSDTLLRVPLIVRFPQKVTPGTRESRTTQLGDLFATILDVAGVDDSVLGASQAVSLFRASDRDAVFAEYYRPTAYLEAFERLYPSFDASRFDCRMRSIRKGDRKYTMTTAGGRELFDVAADPGELHDLADANPEELDALDERLSAWLAESCPAADLVDVESSESLKEQLEALGYLE